MIKTSALFSLFFIYLFSVFTFSYDTFSLDFPDNKASVFYRNKLFYLSSQDKLVKLNLFGNKEWAVKATSSSHCQAFLNKIYFLDEQGHLVCHSSDYGLHLWTLNTSTFSSFSVGYPYVFALSEKGHVYGIDIESGLVNWVSGKQRFSDIGYVSESRELLGLAKNGQVFRLSPLTGHVFKLKKTSHVSGPGVLIQLSDWHYYNQDGQFQRVEHPVLSHISGMDRPYVLQSLDSFLTELEKETTEGAKWFMLSRRFIKKSVENAVFIYHPKNWQLKHSVHLKSDDSKILAYNELPNLIEIVTEKFGYYVELE